MLHWQEKKVRDLLLKGSFGLEKEGLRVDGNGFFAHTPHPFKESEGIVRDFCENQTEINTPVMDSPEAAVAWLQKKQEEMQYVLANLEEPEYLWPFSNPPYIRQEEDIPIAWYEGEEAHKTRYREYLSERYGRYKMTFSGIHINYSFSEALLRADFAYTSQKDFRAYKDRFYVELAEKLLAYGWILVAVTAASPVVDSSFLEKGVYDGTVFQGMASLRCSEQGYWNFFTPVLSYTDLESYMRRMSYYVQEGWIRYLSELYFPIRLKPPGKNTLENLRAQGVSHIELRMIDLNPLDAVGLDVRDVKFAQLLLVWLASRPRLALAEKEQVQSIQNFKNASHYDLKTVKIVLPDQKVVSVAKAALTVIHEMQAFYAGISKDADGVLAFQEAKFIEQSNRYSWRVREQFGEHFVNKGLNLAIKRQKDVIKS